MRKEVIQEIFFPAPTRDGAGNVVPAPQEAQLFCQAFSKGWMRDYPRSESVVPSVDMHPVREESREGYVVQKLLIQKR
jgi:hypothetical protein